MKASLSVVLADAVEDRIIAHNPALAPSRRNRRRPDQVSPTEAVEHIRPFTPHEIDALLMTEWLRAERTKQWRDFTYYLELAGCGLRPGEGCGLQRSDVDTAMGALRIVRSIGKGRRVKLTKTRTRRTVDVPPDVVAWLVRIST